MLAWLNMIKTLLRRGESGVEIILCVFSQPSSLSRREPKNSVSPHCSHTKWKKKKREISYFDPLKHSLLKQSKTEWKFQNSRFSAFFWGWWWWWWLKIQQGAWFMRNLWIMKHSYDIDGYQAILEPKGVKNLHSPLCTLISTGTQQARDWPDCLQSSDKAELNGVK